MAFVGESRINILCVNFFLSLLLEFGWYCTLTHVYVPYTCVGLSHVLRKFF